MRMRKRWVNSSRRTIKTFDAVCSESWELTVVAERVLEKNSRDVSSIGWKTIRAASDPVTIN